MKVNGILIRNVLHGHHRDYHTYFHCQQMTNRIKDSMFGVQKQHMPFTSHIWANVSQRHSQRLSHRDPRNFGVLETTDVSFDTRESHRETNDYFTEKLSLLSLYSNLSTQSVSCRIWNNSQSIGPLTPITSRIGKQETSDGAATAPAGAVRLRVVNGNQLAVEVDIKKCDTVYTQQVHSRTRPNIRFG